MKQEIKLLPLAELYGKEFLVDVEKRQFRNFRDADDIVKMHSEEGRQMLKEMKGSDWKNMGISTGIA